MYMYILRDTNGTKKLTQKKKCTNFINHCLFL